MKIPKRSTTVSEDTQFLLIYEPIVSQSIQFDRNGESIAEPNPVNERVQYELSAQRAFPLTKSEPNGFNQLISRDLRSGH
jgi:hypothetical protein